MSTNKNNPTNREHSIEELRTLANTYGAILLDVRTGELTFTSTPDERATPDFQGKAELAKGILESTSQIKAITVLAVNDRYEVLDNEAFVVAMQQLDYKMVSVIVISNNDKDLLDRMREGLKKWDIYLPYKVLLERFDDIKSVIQKARKESKAQGKDVMNTDAIIADLLGISTTYVKDLAKIAASDQRDELGKRLDAGESIHAVRKELAPKPNAPRSCDIPKEYDIATICPECPKRLEFMKKLEQKQAGTNEEGGQQ